MGLISLDGNRGIAMLDRSQISTLYAKAQPAALDGFLACEGALKTAGLLDGANRIQFFLAQLGHESGGLTVREENLNYSAPRLMAVWPSRFPSLAAAQPYARNPEKLADKVYAGRMGNASPGDGWRYRGRGYIQLTGRDAYRAVGRLAGLDLEANPDQASDPRHAPAIAAAFWTWKNINPACDAGDFVTCTRKINGGTVGLDDRKEWLAKAQAAVTWPPDSPGVARLKTVQRALQARGLYDGSIDGIIGQRSRSGIRAVQAEAGLPVTGQLDARTLQLLGA